MQKESQLLELQQIVVEQKAALLKVVETIKEEGVSNYPILWMYTGSARPNLGIYLGELAGGAWQHGATTLEELYTKGIIEAEKIDNFRALYNHKGGHFCVLMMSLEQTELVFLPYSLVKNENQKRGGWVEERRKGLKVV